MTKTASSATAEATKRERHHQKDKYEYELVALENFSVCYNFPEHKDCAFFTWHYTATDNNSQQKIIITILPAGYCPKYHVGTEFWPVL